MAIETNRASNAFSTVTLALPVRPFVAKEPLSTVRWTATVADTLPLSPVFVSLSGRAPPTC